MSRECRNVPCEKNSRLIAQAHQTRSIRLGASPLKHLDNRAIVGFQGMSRLNGNGAGGIVGIGEGPVRANGEEFA